jgi:hypothetical protein
MCYVSPGPRCSSHASAALKKASNAFKEAAVSGDEEATITARENLTKASDDFYMTPKGQDYLKAKIKETGDPSGDLFFKLEYGILAREEAIRLAKTTDVGDNDTHAAARAAAAEAEAEATRLDQEHAEMLKAEKDNLDAENVVRKSRGLRPVSNFQNLSLDSPVGGYSTYDASLTPQAPDLEKISSLVDAVDNGANTAAALGEAFNMTARDGSYYANGTEYIGLVRKTEVADGVNEYELTENGRIFKAASPENRSVLLRELVNETPLMKAYAESGRSREQLEEYIRDTGYEESVAKRRASSLITWDRKLNSDGFVQELATSSELTQRLSVEAAKNARILKEERLRKIPTVRTYGVCNHCYSHLPATGRCDCQD